MSINSCITSAQNGAAVKKPLAYNHYPAVLLPCTRLLVRWSVGPYSPSIDIVYERLKGYFYSLYAIPKYVELMRSIL